MQKIGISLDNVSVDCQFVDVSLNKLLLKYDQMQPYMFVFASSKTTYFNRLTERTVVVYFLAALIILEL